MWIFHISLVLLMWIFHIGQAPLMWVFHISVAPSDAHASAKNVVKKIPPISRCVRDPALYRAALQQVWKGGGKTATHQPAGHLQVGCHGQSVGNGGFVCCGRHYCCCCKTGHMWTTSCNITCKLHTGPAQLCCS